MKKHTVAITVLTLIFTAAIALIAASTYIFNNNKYIDLFAQGSLSKFTEYKESLPGNSPSPVLSPGNIVTTPSEIIKTASKSKSNKNNSSASTSSSSLSSAVSSAISSSGYSSSVTSSASQTSSIASSSGSQAQSSSISSSSASSSSGTVSSPPQTDEQRKMVLGFATKYSSTDLSSYNSIKNNSTVLDEIATFTYTADEYGNLSGAAPKDQIDLARVSGIRTYALVHNIIGGNFNMQSVQALLRSPSARQNLISNLLTQMRNNGYHGVNVDFENVSYTDRGYYTQLIKEMKEAFAPLGLMVTISIPAKTSDSPTNAWSGAFDYKALGSYADVIVLMTYDEHGPWSAPGAIASIGWVTDVVKYAVSVMPKERIMLGLAAYGYDWSSSGDKALSLSQIDNRIATYGGSVVFDSVTKSPYYIYTANGVKHTVWFENSQSISYKLDLINIYDLRGAAVWRLGLENAGYFNTIKNKIG